MALSRSWSLKNILPIPRTLEPAVGPQIVVEEAQLLLINPRSGSEPELEP